MRSLFCSLSVLLIVGAIGCIDAIGDRSQSSSDEAYTLECDKLDGDVEVVFDCTEVHVSSCKDISNVVLEFGDGTHQKIDDLSGTTGTFSGSGDYAGEEIVGVWVKAGNNASGDGPGYGEYFAAPADSCEEEPDEEPEPDAGPEPEPEPDGGAEPACQSDVSFTCTDLMVTACDELASVTLLFIDGSEETFDALSGMTGTFTGTAGLEVSGAWIMVIGEVSGEFFASPGGMCEREEPPGPDPECDYEACVEECEAQGGEYCDYECNC